MPRARRFLLVLLLLALGPVLAADARLDDADFAALKKKASSYMKAPGKAPYKADVIRKLGEDDQLRSVEVLVDWATTSMKKVKREYAPAHLEATEDLEKFEAMLKKGRPGQEWPPKSLPKPDKDTWDAKKRALATAKSNHEVELATRYELSRAIENTRDPEAIEWILKKGLKKLRKEDLTEAVARAAVFALTQADRALVEKALLKEAMNAKEPASRVLALGWVGENKPEGAFELAVESLEARHAVVRRAAVKCLRALNDTRCIKPLIDALRTARGVIPLEIEAVLYYYTGVAFEGSHVIWLKWWEDHGEEWLQSDEKEERHIPEDLRRSSDGTYFYGLRTDSNRIVFVLDRSGSMKTPASAQERQAGGGAQPALPGGEPEEGEIEGDTKIEVAKNQLIWSLEHLPKDVFFNVVFYSSDVQVWKDPPAMMPATKENKQAAVEWVKAITADGSTALFDALLKALEFADNLDEKDPTKGGCDTIFLLSDGSPTKEGGQVVIQGEELEELWEKVKHANRVFQCVIHTVGVGRGHNRTLMMRIANETKGTYKAVGTD